MDTKEVQENIVTTQDSSVNSFLQNSISDVRCEKDYLKNNTLIFFMNFYIFW